MGKRAKQIFHQRRHTVANKLMKTCSTSYVIRGLQIKTPKMTPHLLEWLKLKILTPPTSGEAMDIQMIQSLGKTV
jgi:hypothetical protein